jgi:thiol-disulfide isomerase/thioredoxin
MIIAAGVYFGFFRKKDNGSGNDGIDIPDSDWLDSYSPKFRVNTYDDDWWISYPQQNPSSGGQVSHPSWITDRIKDKTIVVFAHSDNCVPCIKQQESISAMMKVYGNDIQLLDLLSGSDARAMEAFKAYDPNGSPNYIPLTAIITLADDNGGTVRITWHSFEGATGDEWLDNYVKDAIYYHHRNAARWS